MDRPDAVGVGELMGDENKIRDAADAVKGLAEAVPVYQDIVQPAAREIGPVLGRSVRAALAPLRGIIWGVERIEEWVCTEVAHNLKDTPPESIVTPPLVVAGPIYQSLMFTGEVPELRRMYAALLTTAMRQETQSLAHPAFAEMIRQMQPDEAILLQHFGGERPLNYPLLEVRSATPGGGYVRLQRHFGTIGWDAGCVRPNFLPEYVDNLVRLGLLETPSGAFLMNVERYAPLENHAIVQGWRQQLQPGREIEFLRYILSVTSLGVQFLEACRPPKD
jgi:hypothetical protein